MTISKPWCVFNVGIKFHNVMSMCFSCNLRCLHNKIVSSLCYPPSALCNSVNSLFELGSQERKLNLNRLAKEFLLNRKD